MSSLLFPIALVQSFLSGFFAQSAGRLFTARFARLHKSLRLLVSRKDALKNMPVILIGLAPYNRLFAVCPTNTQKELANAILLGKTRVGKGLSITTNLLSWPFPVIVNDIKREFWEATSGWRQKGLTSRTFLSAISLRLSSWLAIYVILPAGSFNSFDQAIRAREYL